VSPTSHDAISVNFIMHGTRDRSPSSRRLSYKSRPFKPSAPYLSHLQSTSSLINHGCHANQLLRRVSGYRTHTTRYTLNPFPKLLSRSKQTSTVSLTSGRHGAALAELYHPSSINFPTYPNFRLSVSTKSTSIPRKRSPRRWA